jgi:hypothetical protein
MSLTLQQLQEMTSGFAASGYACIQRPSSQKNPVKLRWTDVAGIERRFRLWVFDITHGGGGRDDKEFRIQITNAPSSEEGMDHGGFIDLVMGYSPSRRVLVAYDRRWLEKRMEKGKGSPSVQVSEQDIQAALVEGMHHITKSGVAFGTANILTLKPEFFPEYLTNHDELLSGSMGGATVSNANVTGDVSLWQFCLDRGFYFEPDMLARYVASIAAKPFVILAGVSGTGKSKMAELVAEFYSAARTAETSTTVVSNPEVGNEFIFVAGSVKPERDRFALVPVRPDWIDNQSIMGFVNPISGRYESTLALDLMLRASASLERSTVKAAAPRFFMLLDEMNLARVEHYFSDWLACSESRRLQPDGTISQQPIPLHRHAEAKASILGGGDSDSSDISVPSALAIPTNLIVTGTVNIDETTFGFSPKVLDRSMVIEFNDVDLDGMRRGVAVTEEHGYRFPDTLPLFRLATAETFQALPQETHNHLVAINRIMEKAQLHFGYRSAAEISLFMEVYNSILPEDDEDTMMLRALDGALLQKVLPRIQGNRARLEATLCTLLWYLRDLSMPGPAQDARTIARGDVARLPNSYSRGFEMLERLREFGFVTFFK